MLSGYRSLLKTCSERAGHRPAGAKSERKLYERVLRYNANAHKHRDGTMELGAMKVQSEVSSQAFEGVNHEEDRKFPRNVAERLP